MPITLGKISGTCGRLLCCLNYEYANYVEAAKQMTPVGSGVITPDGLGAVESVNLLNGKITVKLQDGKNKEFMRDEVEMVDADVNIKIDKNKNKNYSTGEEPVSNADIKELEDNRNSTTGDV
jgi:hypothetical protein